VWHTIRQTITYSFQARVSGLLWCMDDNPHTTLCKGSPRFKSDEYKRVVSGLGTLKQAKS